ncbi:Ca2+-binding EF-hand superfamily protein [Neorhizobium galegae]|uniref:calcium-binding protein n=1 Tax=Neorhizobium galegae TaxID=399 RepID=UPI001AE71416|nr:calcium-binding protein [Neorhizobium galegae]MBP2559825.1 Ca2+-binding EF-hand superfamily protein [Neorhizobium galegae]
MTAKKIALATLGAVLIAGAAIPAFAAPGRDGPGRHDGPGRAMMQDVMFVRLLKNADADKDGKISKDEMAAFQDKLFTAVDANKDGSLTRGEMFDYRQAKIEEFRKNNQPEVANTADQKDDQSDHDMADRRGDHRRDRDHSAWNHEGQGRHGGRREDARWERPHGHHMMGRGMFGMVDEDRDGKITKAEASAASDKLFARMDTNKDGTISIDDLPDRPL